MLPVLQEVRLARELCKTMRAQIAEATIAMRGAAASAALAERSCRVFCFWRGERSPAAVEHCIVFEESGREIIDGVAPGETAVIACVREWVVNRCPLDVLLARFPYFDRGWQQLLRLAKLIEPCLPHEPRLRIVIEQYAYPELWIDGDRRSCRIGGRDDACWCELLIASRRVARAFVDEGTLASVVSAWTQAKVALEDLGRLPGLVTEPHPERQVSGEVACQRWLGVVERVQNEFLLARLRPLIEQIRNHPSITQFFPFFSVFRLRFSSSSQHRFVTDGLPIISPVDSLLDRREQDDQVGEVRYVVELGDERFEAGITETIERIEAALAAAPYRPFHGSETDLITSQVDAELVQQGSSLRVELVRIYGSNQVAMQRASRFCVVYGRTPWYAAFAGEGRNDLEARFAEIAELVRAARRWLEDIASLDEMHAEIESSSFVGRRGSVIVIR